MDINTNYIFLKLGKIDIFSRDISSKTTEIFNQGKAGFEKAYSWVQLPKDLTWEKFSASFSWSPDFSSWMPKFTQSPLLISGVTTISAGTLIDNYLPIPILGTFLKCSGVICFIIAAYTKDDTKTPQEGAIKSISILDRAVIVVGIAGAIGAMVEAVFSSSAWVVFCLSLSGVALIRSQNFIGEFDVWDAFRTENVKLKDQVTTLESTTKDLQVIKEGQDRSLQELQQTSASYENQIQVLSAQTSKHEQNNLDLKNLNKELTTTVESLKELFTKSNEANGEPLEAILKQWENLLQKNIELSTLIQLNEKTLTATNEELSQTSDKLAQRTIELRAVTERLQQIRELISIEIERLTIVSTQLSGTTSHAIPSATESNTSSLTNAQTTQQTLTNLSEQSDVIIAFLNSQTQSTNTNTDPPPLN